MANLEIKLSANKRQPYLRHRVVGRVGDGGLTTINVQLLEEDEITPFVINLNGTLKFVGEVSNGNYTEGEPEIIDSTNGLISYTFTKSNFSTSHQFKQAYFEYVDPNGKKVTFQNFIIDVLERVDINSEQAKYYISSLEKLQSEMQTTFNQFISDKQVQYDQIYSKYNELVRLINESDKQVNDRIDQTNQQIGDLGKLKKMYSNSIDFGGYDYSGRANLMPKLKSPDFNSGYHGSITDVNGMLHFTSDGTGSISMFTRINTPALASGKTYTLSAKVRFDEGTTGAIDKLRLVYRTSPGEKILLEANSTNITTDDVGKEITIKGTANVNYQITNVERFYMTVSFTNQAKINGGFKLYDIKIEEGTTATPYQPNLLDAPYYLSKVPLGENIANKGTTFPIKSSAYEIYKGNTEEELIIGQTYTITLKGTKPASQTFVAYNYWNVNFGDLKPVEGLTDVWSLTFTPTKLEPGLPKDLRIFQSPKETAGACQIDWLKIEKGATRTPNISEYKYFGEGLKDSNNPNDYSWDITPEYTEKGLNNTVSLTEPQSIEGLKNFEDGIQSKGKSVLTSDDNKYEVVTLTVTNGNTGSAKLYREGKTVTIYFFALNGKSSGGNDSTILTIPEGYRPPISFEQLVGSIDRSTLNSAQLSIGADGAIKWRRNSSYGSDYTFAITYTI
ncbi:BppU family phage baseplate upper protein [Enterococcus faecium]|uniref:BppU family phage baseplate upper protein n=1 Tax=Enterococcus faecium TaxID=1352 RepID=UPI001E5609C6|nr:phage baseplate upper protein [Enterococcus faecium]MCE3104174.1 phage baseplate upper protein [Enterococcus faecium]MCE3148930.1 phage baseplate upper protein [Enterococcus faecium]MCE3159488.1 phage baseplate upper protein [Enterococcus faecium]MCE3162469.1 phage baseplate upper protein [Enterococcus faecium]